MANLGPFSCEVAELEPRLWWTGVDCDSWVLDASCCALEACICWDPRDDTGRRESWDCSGDGPWPFEGKCDSGLESSDWRGRRRALSCLDKGHMVKMSTLKTLCVGEVIPSSRRVTKTGGARDRSIAKPARALGRPGPDPGPSWMKSYSNFPLLMLVPFATPKRVKTNARRRSLSHGLHPSSIEAARLCVRRQETRERCQKEQEENLIDFPCSSRSSGCIELARLARGSSMADCWRLSARLRSRLWPRKKSSRPFQCCLSLYPLMNLDPIHEHSSDVEDV